MPTDVATAQLGISVYVEDKRAGVADALAKMNSETSKFGRTFGANFRDVSTMLRRGVSEVRFFGAALAGAFGIQLSSIAIANEIQRVVQEYKAGQLALSQFAGQERIAGQNAQSMRAAVEELAKASGKLFGASTEQTAQLAAQARALGLNTEQTYAAVQSAQTLNKVAGKDTSAMLDLIGRGLLGNTDAMKQFGQELRLRVTDADGFVAALRRVTAEQLEAQATAEERTFKNNSFASQFAYQQAEAAALPKIQALRAQAEVLRKQSGTLVTQGSGSTEQGLRLQKLTDDARTLTNVMAELARSASLTDSLPDQIRQIEIKTSAELDKLTEDYLATAKKLFEEGITPGNNAIASNLVSQFLATRQQIGERQARDIQNVQRQAAQFETEVQEATRQRLAIGRDREQVDIEVAQARELRSLEELHRQKRVSEATYQAERAAIVEEGNRRMQVLTGTGGDGAMAALREGAESLLDAYGRGKRAVEDFGDAFEKNLGQAAYDAVTKAKTAAGAIKSFAKGFFDDIARSASQSLAGLARAGLFAGLKALFGAGGGTSDPFAANPGNVGADGGWFDSGGWHGARVSGASFARMSRGADVRRFAEGGMVTRPTLGLFGEAGPEAFVPLKGGRIPVSIRGGGGGSTINLYLSAIDTQSGLSFLAQHREFLWGLQRDGFDRRSEFRGMARRT